MIDQTYFVYLHRRPDTGAVFYIGKGTRTHAKQYGRASVARRRSSFWHAVVEKAGGFTVEVIADFWTEDDAFDMERALIAQYGRRSDGGSLCNLTLGGEGHAGLPISASARAKLSAAFSGERHFNWGKRLSEETCRRKSESMKTSPHNLKGKTLPPEWRAALAAGKVGAKNPRFGKTGAEATRSKRVRDRATGAVYDSVALAAAALGVNVKTLYNRIATGSKLATLEFI